MGLRYDYFHTRCRALKAAQRFLRDKLPVLQQVVNRPQLYRQACRGHRRITGMLSFRGVWILNNQQVQGIRTGCRRIYLQLRRRIVHPAIVGQQIFAIHGISPSQGDVLLRQIKSIAKLSLRHGWLPKLAPPAIANASQAG